MKTGWPSTFSLFIPISQSGALFFGAVAPVDSCRLGQLHLFFYPFSSGVGSTLSRDWAIQPLSIKEYGWSPY
jgi:hypothetical protein